MVEGKPLADSLDDFRKLIQDLEIVEINVSEEDQGVIILNSLHC